jgi:hypothetical protein
MNSIVANSSRQLLSDKSIKYTVSRFLNRLSKSVDIFKQERERQRETEIERNNERKTVIERYGYRERREKMRER